MANKDCQKCGKTIDTEKESIFYLDSSTAPQKNKKGSKRICVDCWETGKDKEWINCCDVLEEIPLSQSSVRGSDGKLLKVRKIIRIQGIYTPKPKANETDNLKSLSSNDTKQEKQMVQSTEKSNKMWVGFGIALLIGIMLGSLIVLWLLKTPKGKGSKESK